MVNLDATTPQLRAVKKWIEAYNTLKVENLEPLISKNFTYKVLPDLGESPVSAKGRHLERFGWAAASFSKTESIIHDVVEAPGRVILHATWKCTTLDNATLNIESVLFLTLAEEDGELKIAEFKNFANTEGLKTFYAGITKVVGAATS